MNASSNNLSINNTICTYYTYSVLWRSNCKFMYREESVNLKRVILDSNLKVVCHIVPTTLQTSDWDRWRRTKREDKFWCQKGKYNTVSYSIFMILFHNPYSSANPSARNCKNNCTASGKCLLGRRQKLNLYPSGCSEIDSYNCDGFSSSIFSNFHPLATRSVSRNF